MSLHNDRLTDQSLQSATQQALYRAGRFKLDAQFEPWSDYLQQAIETAALYGLAINVAESITRGSLPRQPQGLRWCARLIH